MALTVAVLLTQVTPGRAQSEAKGTAGKHKTLGLTVGTVAGTILGLWAGWKAVDDDGGGGLGTFVTVWAACAAGGAVVGYTAGGGFSHELDVALDAGRAKLRGVAAARDPRELESLRLTPLAGLEDEGVADPVLEREPARRLELTARLGS